MVGGNRRGPDQIVSRSANPKPLSSQTVRHALGVFAASLSAEEEDLESISTHSLRKGGLQALVDLGMQKHLCQKQGNWKSQRSMEGVYMQLAKSQCQKQLSQLFK